MTDKISFVTPLYVLAPLAGFTDLPFRSVVKKFGADLTVSEMISSNALAYGSKKTIKMLEKSSLEDPYSVQIAANDTSDAIAPDWNPESRPLIGEVRSAFFRRRRQSG